MSRYAVIDADTGACFFIRSGVLGIPEEAEWREGTRVVEVGDDVAATTHYFVDDVATVFPDSPSTHHTWDWVTHSWVDPRTLQDHKDARNRYVNVERLKANQTSFTHLGKSIVVDLLSRSDIDAINGEVANTGAFPAGWPGAWKCMDNSYLTVATVADWKALYTSMVNQGTQNFGHAQALKVQIEGAITPDELALIVW